MGIGILNEGPLHAALKSAYAANGGETEVSVGTFVADAVRNGIMYEIQTGSFSGLGRKMAALADVGPVVLVHPIPQSKTIVKLPRDGAQQKQTRRRSPKHGELIHIVDELVYLPTLLKHPNFSVEAVLTVEEEVREYDPKKRRGRGGWRVVQRRLLEVGEGWRINHMRDLLDQLHTDLPEPFSTQDLALALEQPRDVAQKMAYCLRHAGASEVCGKDGNALLYSLCSAP